MNDGSERSAFCWRFQRSLSKIVSHKHSLKLVLSIALRRTGWCKAFIIDRDLYRIRFFPTALSQELWIDPNGRKADERFFRAVLRRGDHVIDIGANVGTLTLAAARLVGEIGAVWSLEPHPRVFRYLQANVAMNGFHNVRLFNLAAGAETGTLCLSDKRDDDQNGIVQDSSLHVAIKPLDELIPDCGTVHLLKVDVEGYEKFVFQGALETLRKTECVYFERSDEHYRKYGYTSADVLLLLRGLGYQFFRDHFSGDSVVRLQTNQPLPQRSNIIAIRDPAAFHIRTGLAIID